MLAIIIVWFACAAALLTHRVFDYVKHGRPALQWGTLVRMINAPIVLVLAAMLMNESNSI